VQAGHAAIDFQHQHSEIAKDWHQNSNYLIFLTTEDLRSLEKLMLKADAKGIKYTSFYEPDVDEITAVAFEPTDAARKLTSSLKLITK
jgi:hypothetical protein